MIPKNTNSDSNSLSFHQKFIKFKNNYPPPQWPHLIFSLFSILLPCIIIFIIAFALPFTSEQTINETLYNLTGNLFHDFTFWDGFWYAVTLAAVAWAALMTAYALMDSERERIKRLFPKGCPDETHNQYLLFMPKDGNPIFKLPVSFKVFSRYTLLWVGPGFYFVVAHAASKLGTLIGLLAGLGLAYILLELIVWFTRSASLYAIIADKNTTSTSEYDYGDVEAVMVLGWNLVLPRVIGQTEDSLEALKAQKPGIVGAIGFFLARQLSAVPQGLPLQLPRYIYMGKNICLLRGAHLFAAMNTAALMAVYGVFLILFHPYAPTSTWLLEHTPSVAFVFAWLTFFSWCFLALWMHLRRYRTVLLALFLWTFIWYAVGELNSPVRIIFYTISALSILYFLRRSPLFAGLYVVLLGVWSLGVSVDGTSWDDRFNPAHTYSVDRVTIKPFKTTTGYRKHQLLYPEDLLCALGPKEQEATSKDKQAPKSKKPKKKPTLILVAASGGGILAAGWTVRVLTSLQRAYPNFAKELRLISSNSGGSVGSAHYLHAYHLLKQISDNHTKNQEAPLKQIVSEKKKQKNETNKHSKTQKKGSKDASKKRQEQETWACPPKELSSKLSKKHKQEMKLFEDVVNNAMTSSLTTTGYGLFFVDMLRMFLPIQLAPGRGRLLERNWRAYTNNWLCDKLCKSNSLKSSEKKKGSTQQTRLSTAQQKQLCRLCRKNQRIRLYDLRQPIKSGELPGFIFHTTVMESGELIALTPLSTISQRVWPEQDPQREKEWQVKEKDKANPRFINVRTLGHLLNSKSRTLPTRGYERYTLDLWTAARLSATFSYISPAARASLVNQYKKRKSLKKLFEKMDNSGALTKSSTVRGFGLKQWGEQTYVPKQQLLHISNEQLQTLKWLKKPHLEQMKKGLSLHMIDGGYHENFGVLTLLSWLDSVLFYFKTHHNREVCAKSDPKGNCILMKPKSAFKCPALKNSIYTELKKDLPFGQIALIEIRAGSDKKRLDATAASSWMSAMLGPALGVVNSWSLSQRSSNDSLLYQMVQKFNGLGIPMRTFTFTYEKHGPLSWHLSKQQKGDICRQWYDNWNINVSKQKGELERFLKFVQPSSVQSTTKPIKKR